MRRVFEAPLDAARKRDEKIERYKRCKELDEKVTYLRLAWFERCKRLAKVQQEARRLGR